MASPVNGIVKPALMPIEARAAILKKRSMEDRRESLLKAIHHAQRRPEDDPSNAQTLETISAHYRNSKVGDTAVIRETYGGFLNFRVTKIETIKGPRIYLADGAPYGGPAFLSCKREKLSQSDRTGPSRHSDTDDSRLRGSQPHRQKDRW
jgi:hypothetical protein